MKYVILYAEQLCSLYVSLHTLDVAYQLISTDDKFFILICSDDESCVGGVSVRLLLKV
jgi:hypothetical protein